MWHKAKGGIFFRILSDGALIPRFEGYSICLLTGTGTISLKQVIREWLPTTLQIKYIFLLIINAILGEIDG